MLIIECLNPEHGVSFHARDEEEAESCAALAEGPKVERLTLPGFMSPAKSLLPPGVVPSMQYTGHSTDPRLAKAFKHALRQGISLTDLSSPPRRADWKRWAFDEESESTAMERARFRMTPDKHSSGVPGHESFLQSRYGCLPGTEIRKVIDELLVTTEGWFDVQPTYTRKNVSRAKKILSGKVVIIRDALGTRKVHPSGNGIRFAPSRKDHLEVFRSHLPANEVLVIPERGRPFIFNTYFLVQESHTPVVPVLAEGPVEDTSVESVESEATGAARPQEKPQKATQASSGSKKSGA